MSGSSDTLRLILGLKLRNLRVARGEGLRDVASRAGLSVSYLSELEQGKKYPKPDKLLRLAAALESSYDDLVSLKVGEELGPVKQAVDSRFLSEFPFELFGLEREDHRHLVVGHGGEKRVAGVGERIHLLARQLDRRAGEAEVKGVPGVARSVPREALVRIARAAGHLVVTEVRVLLARHLQGARDLRRREGRPGAGCRARWKRRSCR